MDINTNTSIKLRDLFTFHASTPCHTHELLGCACQNASADPGADGEGLNFPSEDETEGGWTIASQLNTDKVNQKVSQKMAPNTQTLTFLISSSNKRRKNLLHLPVNGATPTA